MAVEQKDKFANQAMIRCVESAANTLTFKKLETGISLFDKVAWVISRIEYLLSMATYGYFNSTADVLAFGLTTVDTLTTLDIANSAVLDYNYIGRIDLGTAASGGFFFQPFVKDFAALPGGGLIVPPNPIYLAGVGTGLSTASTIVAKMFYTQIVLKPEEFWELVEARRMISAP